MKESKNNNIIRLQIRKLIKEVVEEEGNLAVTLLYKYSNGQGEEINFEHSDNYSGDELYRLYDYEDFNGNFEINVSVDGRILLLMGTYDGKTTLIAEPEREGAFTSAPGETETAVEATLEQIGVEQGGRSEIGLNVLENKHIFPDDLLIKVEADIAKSIKYKLD